MLRVVKSLLCQVDHLNVYLNGYSHVPAELESTKITVARSQDWGDRGDAGKFFWADCVDTDYHLVCDDDLRYPSTYSRFMVDGVKRFDQKAVVGLHGALIKTPFTSYYTSRVVVGHFSGALPRDLPVHLLGTGVLCYHRDAIRVHPSDFRIPNMADIWMAVLGQAQSVPFVCLKHTAGYVTDYPAARVDSIFTHAKRKTGSAKDTNAAQTAAVKKTLPWKIYAAR